MKTKSEEISEERLQELRRALYRIDPGGRRRWVLEVFELRDGQNVIRQALDIKTGKPVKVPRG